MGNAIVSISLSSISLFPGKFIAVSADYGEGQEERNQEPRNGVGS